MTLVLGLAAVNTGNNLLYLLVAALLGLLIVSGLLGRANLGGLRVRLRFPEEVYADTPTAASLIVENHQRRARFLLQAEVEEGAAHFPLIAARSAEDQPLSLTFGRRGRRRIGGVRLKSAFPVGFFQRGSWLPLDQEVIVLPRPRPCALPVEGSGRQIRGRADAPRAGHEGDLLGIADYSGQEPLKLIHWKHSARHDSIKVKQLSATAARPLWINLAHCPGTTLEERLGSATYLINLGWRSGRPLGLRLGERVLAPGRGRRHRLRLLHELALYDAH
ncbi:DUF58 domain-containing protein [Geoalkalibacter halelectricus]|uniref:DUF58 domain-containing protein n=1 Tax=Geoalkalibacter halelectricus TaxID=2847045 RepID=UPI003D1CFCD1